MESFWQIACLVIVALIVLGIVIGYYDDRAFWSRKRISTHTQILCRECLGTGWISRSQRTMNFNGEGFDDVQKQSVQCSRCRGTGYVHT